MTFAFWMVLVAALLPYFCTALAKFGGAGYDNAAPRLSLDGLSGWRARADWAHRNHFEAFAPFAAGVLVATYAHAAPGRLNLLAGGFIAMRVLYSLAYVAGWATMRSLVWGMGFGCMVALFCIAA